MNRYREARRYAISQIDGEVAKDVPFIEVAKKLASRSDVIIEGLDLSNKQHAKAFILAFYYRNAMRLRAW